MKTRIERVKLADLKPLELNARYMTHQQHQTLVANIKRDGALTSVPFAALDSDGRYTILSGNHRVAAALEAGVTEADVMLTDEPLDEAQRIAIQLSHNAIVGQDDPATLKLLYQQIDELDWREYSGLDDATLQLLAKVETPPLTDEPLRFLTVTIVFLPEEAERAREAFANARALVSGSELYLARFADYDRLLDALDSAGRSYDVRNTAVGIMIVLDVFERHLDELGAGWREMPNRKARVPLVSVLGTDELPVADARLVDRAITAAVEKGEATSRWDWLTIAAKRYLEEPKR